MEMEQAHTLVLLKQNKGLNELFKNMCFLNEMIKKIEHMTKMAINNLISKFQ